MQSGIVSSPLSSSVSKSFLSFVTVFPLWFPLSLLCLFTVWSDSVYVTPPAFRSEMHLWKRGILRLYHHSLSPPLSHIKESLTFQCFKKKSLSSQVLVCWAVHCPLKVKVNTPLVGANWECFGHISQGHMNTVPAISLCDSLACTVPAHCIYLGMRGCSIGVIPTTVIGTVSPVCLLCLTSSGKCWWTISFNVCLFWGGTKTRQNTWGEKKKKRLHTLLVLQLKREKNSYASKIVLDT